MTQRRRARSLALQLLYALDISPADKKEVEELFWEGKKTNRKVREFTEILINGTRENITYIDHLISQCADNWRLDRLSTIDRNVLRLATYELLHLKDIPPIVSIDEAIELARTYSTSDSPAFVNGVLDKIRKVVEEDAG